MFDVIFNGRVLQNGMNGIPRYAWEILLEFDKMLDNDLKMAIVIPKCNSKDIVSKFQNIPVIELPNRLLWDYVEAERYACNNKAIYVNFANKGGFYKKSIVTFHDIRLIDYECWKLNLKQIINKIKFWIMFTIACINDHNVVTVSNFSKKAISRFIDNKRITVIEPGWEHIRRIDEDPSIFDSYSYLNPHEYYLSIGSIAPHKNFKWIIDNAKKNPNEVYVIVGAVNRALWSDDTSSFVNNVKYIGFQSDERLKTLILNAKGFLFPSFYEGFGIPPLEALSLGTRTIVSDIEVMHEIFGPSVSYISPKDSNIILNRIKFKHARDKEILSYYSWKRSALKWKELIESMLKK